MSAAPRFPLLAKVLGWLVLHLLILALAFAVFVRWQLGLGLDSLLSGSAGARLAEFGDQVLASIVTKPREEWLDAINRISTEKNLVAGIWSPRGVSTFPAALPANVEARARDAMPPRVDPLRPPRGTGAIPPDVDPPRGPGPGLQSPGAPRRGPGPPLDDEDPAGFPTTSGPFSDSPVILPKCRPVFLVRGDHGDGYWAGILMHLPTDNQPPRRPVLLLIRADRLDGSGLFFDFKPWLLGGIAVLALSLVFWTPFVWNITRYVRRLTSATDQISTGRFHVVIPRRGNDELGDLGRTIESMAARLDHLVTGQKRFLGDAAHELCAPLARIRTGIAILENRIADADTASLASIETDVAELASLVNEILAFSRAGNRPPLLQRINLHDAVHAALRREAADIEALVEIPATLEVAADPALLGRAVGNLLRNASIHAGPHPRVLISAAPRGASVELTVADNGPGVPDSELPRLFEPFYRVDRSRSRDTGGSGLGLAIVRSAVESCGGEVAAANRAESGLAVTIRLPDKVRES